MAAQESAVYPSGTWVNEGTRRRYLDPTGEYVKGQWKGIDGYIYRFDADGYLETSKTLVESDYSRYSLDENGKLYDEYRQSLLFPYTFSHYYTYRADQEWAGYDPQYPLKGLLEEYGLEYQPQVQERERRVDVSVYDSSMFNDKYIGSNTRAVMEFAYALSGNGAAYQRLWQYLCHGDNIISYDLAEMECRYPEVTPVVDEIRKFLNSFDFMHASEYEKVQQVIKYVSRASYDHKAAAIYEKMGGIETNSSLYEQYWPSFGAYGCLVNKKCVCAGYSETFQILCRLVGLLCVSDRDDNHAWNYVRVNGEWWMHSNGELFEPGKTTRMADGDIVPAFENSSYFIGYAEEYDRHPKNWAYLP